MAMPLVPYTDAAGPGRPPSVTGRVRIRHPYGTPEDLRSPRAAPSDDHPDAGPGGGDPTPCVAPHPFRTARPVPGEPPAGDGHRPARRNPIAFGCHRSDPYDQPSDLPRGRKEAVDHPGCAPVQ